MKDLDWIYILPPTLTFVGGVVFLILYLIHTDRKEAHRREVKLLLDIAEYHTQRKELNPHQEITDSVVEFLNLEQRDTPLSRTEMGVFKKYFL